MNLLWSATRPPSAGVHAILSRIAEIEACFDPLQTAFDPVHTVGEQRHIRVDYAKTLVHGCQAGLDRGQVFTNDRYLCLYRPQDFVDKVVGNFRHTYNIQNIGYYFDE